MEPTRSACGRRRIPPHGLKAQRHPAPFLGEDGMFWLRPDLDRTALGAADWLDTALFDIDGVLID
ncbi:MAG TPA: hypothetical protein VID72_01015, partial [Ktedonobacterales bacterium]